MKWIENATTVSYAMTSLFTTTAGATVLRRRYRIAVSHQVQVRNAQSVNSSFNRVKWVTFISIATITHGNNPALSPWRQW